jgi:hypothetical protein
MVTVSRRHPCDHSEPRNSSGPPAAHGPLAGPAAGGAKVGMRRRVGPLRVAQLLRPAYGPRSQEWSRGRRCRDAHASTRSSRGPCTANDPQFSGNFSPRPAVPLRTAPCSSGVARARPTVPVGPVAGGTLRSCQSMRLGHLSRCRSSGDEPESWRIRLAVRYGPWRHGPMVAPN